MPSYHVPVQYTKDDDTAHVQFWLHTSIVKALRKILPENGYTPGDHFARTAFVHAKSGRRHGGIFYQMMIVAKAEDAKAALMVLWKLLKRIIDNDGLDGTGIIRTTGLVATAEHSYKLVNELIDELEVAVLEQTRRVI